MAVSFRSDALSPVDAAAGTPAGFWRRLAAAVVDGAILLLAVLALSLAIVVTIGYEPELWSLENAVYWSLNTTIVWFYYAGQESGVRQATPGKRLMRIRVTDLDGEPVSFARATARHFAKIVSLIPFMAGYLAVAVTRRKQGFHDIIAGCLVVRAGKDA